MLLVNIPICICNCSSFAPNLTSLAVPFEDLNETLLTSLAPSYTFNCPLDRGAEGDAACDRAIGPVTFKRSQSLAELAPEGRRPEGASIQ